MKVIVTGGTGFLGSHLVRECLRRQIDVVLLKRQNSNTSRINDVLGSLMSYDIDKIGVEEAVERERDADAVIHLATHYGRQLELQRVFDTNVRFGFDVLSAASRVQIPRFLNADTCFRRLGKDYGYLGDYILSKQQFFDWGCRFAAVTKTEFVNVELQHPYGPGDSLDKFVPSLVRRCLENEPEIPLTPGEQKKDFIHVADVCSAIFALLTNLPCSGGCQTIECGTGKGRSIRSFVETVHRLTKSSSLLKFGALEYRENEVMESRADIRRLAECGWAPKIDLEAGIQSVIQDIKARAAKG